MEINHYPEKLKFILSTADGTEAGELTYTETENMLSANHTRVYSAFEGKGYARLLLDALVDYARQNGKSINPVCSYVKKAFEQYPEKYKDVAMQAN